MTSQSGGGSNYPGVTSDGAGGLAIQHSVLAGDGTLTAVPDFLAFRGIVAIFDTVANLVDADRLVDIHQQTDIPAGAFGDSALAVTRNGSIAAQDYALPGVVINDQTASAQPILQVQKNGGTLLELNTKPSITGALSTVTDAAAKAVLTSVIAALTGVKVATNNTT